MQVPYLAAVVSLLAVGAGEEGDVGDTAVGAASGHGGHAGESSNGDNGVTSSQLTSTSTLACSSIRPWSGNVI